MAIGTSTFTKSELEEPLEPLTTVEPVLELSGATSVNPELPRDETTDCSRGIRFACNSAGVNVVKLVLGLTTRIVRSTLADACKVRASPNCLVPEQVTSPLALYVVVL